MTKENLFDVIIIGGSYAGLSAGMALGRSLRKVLIIDGGKPCNIQTPHSHNVITLDGESPSAITQKAKNQVLAYDTVTFLNGLATKASKANDENFEVQTADGEIFVAKKLLFATGVSDIMPDIKGFSECWGISILHCPYCHGYEVKEQNTGILGNGEMGFEFSKLISNWTKQLTLFTNGKSTLTKEQNQKLLAHRISIVEDEIESVEHEKGIIKQVVFKNGTKQSLAALYARIPFEQHCKIPATLGCTLTEQGHIQVDDFQRTSIAGIFAAGDNTTMFRSVSNAIGAGNKAGALINHELINEEF
ncbi:NAD(P)/FAD-dependent oxidoreductase [Arcicella rosea]|uniref:Thioredoxin reductase n=1 Tax=Arcicella rosea TaxID=502909 RepID=A0A841ET83_9BACT|nr:NAD(P)/FAD-dependent oxidoreductase [Arcicella rosea]MBB6002661.1 thioredoxin reductase [Arcicella rosea]